MPRWRAYCCDPPTTSKSDRRIRVATCHIVVCGVMQCMSTMLNVQSRYTINHSIAEQRALPQRSARHVSHSRQLKPPLFWPPACLQALSDRCLLARGIACYI